MYFIAKRNKFLALIALILAYFLKGIPVINAAPHMEFQSKIMAAILLAIIIIICFFTTTFDELLSYKQISKLKNKYKYEIIKSVIKSYDYNYQYFAICKTHENVLLKSGIFGNRIDEYYEDDKIWGDLIDQSFILTELEVNKGIKKIFHGIFGIIKIKKCSKDQEKIKDFLNNFTLNYRNKNELNFKLSACGNRIYFALPSKKIFLNST